MPRLMVFVLLLAWLPVVCAQEAGQVQSSALINEALDKRHAALEFSGALPQVMKDIAQKTGVRVEADPAVWELLPWGQMTTISATIKNQTLRESLTAMAHKLGLTYVLNDEAVELQPLPPLRRLGRRATVAELQALDLLASTPANLPASSPTVKALIDAVDQRLVELKGAVAIENRVGQAVKMDQALSVPRNATLAEALEAIVQQTRATWYPWGKSIVILPKEDQIREQLKKEITVRYNGVDVQQVLMELAQRAGVEFSLEPGAMQRISPEFRAIRLVVSNTSIKQVLETISGVTGLNFMVTESGVYLWNDQARAGAGGKMIGLLTLPDLGVQVPLRESEVAPELRQFIQSKTQKELEKLKIIMQEEGFKPTTQPATTGEDL